MKYTKAQIEENRTKWLAQLRSPEAKKTTLKLENSKNPDHRCCLGHACHALGIQREVLESQNTVNGWMVHYGEQTSYLPDEASLKLAILCNGEFVNEIKIDHIHSYYANIEFENLAQINDHTELTPAEIADIIEEQFKANNFKKPGANYKWKDTH